MGQKLVAIQFGKGSSSIFWNQKYSPVFKIEISKDQSTWEDITDNLYYCSKLTKGFPTVPEFPENLETERLTNSRLQKFFQKNQTLNFFVDDNVFYYRIFYKDDFLTLGQWEEIKSGNF